MRESKKYFGRIKAILLKYVCLVGIGGLQACSYNPYVQDYIDVLDNIDYQSFYQHETLGQRSIHQEPLQRVYKHCSSEAFSERTYYLDSVELDNYVVIERVYHDYHAFLMESVMMWGAKNEKTVKNLLEHLYPDNDFKTIRREAFESSEMIEPQLREITYAIKKRDKCLAGQGWLYKKRRAKSSD